MNAGFIGAGKVGTALGRYFVEHGVSVSGYHSAHSSSARLAASRTSTRSFDDARDLVAASDLVFLTVPDAAIADVWRSLRAAGGLFGTIVCHCSGCLSSDVFEGAAEAGALACSAHPLLALSDPLCPTDEIAHAHITLEGDPRAASALRALFERLGNPVHAILPADKRRYHAAAVFASNLVLAPLSEAARLMGECGFNDADAREALAPLVMGNARAFCAKGAAPALTGPVERNDRCTAEGHLAALDGEAARLYRALSMTLVGLAREKHPDRDYSAWNATIGER